MRSVVSVCLSICFLSSFWTKWPLTLIFCICVCHDRSSVWLKVSIIGQGHRLEIGLVRMTMRSQSDHDPQYGRFLARLCGPYLLLWFPYILSNVYAQYLKDCLHLFLISHQNYQLLLSWILVTELHILWSELYRRKLSPTLTTAYYSYPDRLTTLLG